MARRHATRGHLRPTRHDSRVTHVRHVSLRLSSQISQLVSNSMYTRPQSKRPEPLKTDPHTLRLRPLRRERELLLAAIGHRGRRHRGHHRRRAAARRAAGDRAKRGLRCNRRGCRRKCRRGRRLGLRRRWRGRLRILDIIAFLCRVVVTTVARLRRRRLIIIIAVDHLCERSEPSRESGGKRTHARGQARLRRSGTHCACSVPWSSLCLRRRCSSPLRRPRRSRRPLVWSVRPRPPCAAA